ncbi:hypothetical protein BOBR111200_03875 [Bordetella bronchialis]|uniref:Uncharacterized protein n=1 Tax=Bordetella bronchialis TaxID=463025 RepID=A0A193FDS5_9BORD|nr:hypothetical protein BAU06_06135 [Bordetella bronchialis]ANN71011.1 hypothetical protein BAU08_06395 [Bordetella bronchialis]
MKWLGKTDRDRVKAGAAAETPVSHNPDTDPYDPNDETAVYAYWNTAEVTRPGRPRVMVKRPTLNMRVDADVMEHGVIAIGSMGWVFSAVR